MIRCSDTHYGGPGLWRSLWSVFWAAAFARTQTHASTNTQLAVFTNYLQFTRNIFDAAFEMLVYGEWDTVKIFPRWNSNDLYCYNVKYCLNNGACWPNYPSPGTKQASEHWKYLHLCYKNIWGYEKYLSCVTWRAAATWLPTLLPLDSCLACHSEPTMLSRLLLVWSAPTPTTPLRTPWKYFIPLKIF